MRKYSATPRASMLIESMRDIGYSLETALADIIDNSISAHAKRIQVFANFDDSRIGIVDDGEGMTEDELLAAMRPGSRNPLEASTKYDLGRFGLGLKTASFSQCRRFTVVTRRDDITSAAIWDLDFVASENDWIVQIPDKPMIIPFADKLGKSGTLVLWENMDRLIGQSTSAKERKHFNSVLNGAREHLALVFHRFLSGEHGLPKVMIFLNNLPLQPFDPFHSDHPATIRGPVERIRLAGQEVVIQTFTLPHHKKLRPDEWERYAGAAGYIRNQGFYVYREKRLIIYGTWFGLARQENLTKLTRVRVDMPTGLDAEWKIDVKKATAQPPNQIRERLRSIIEEIGQPSKTVYKRRGQNLINDNRLPIWNRVQDKNEIRYQINMQHPVFVDFASRLPEGLKADFLRVAELIGSTLPMDAVFADMGGSPEKMRANSISNETLQHTIHTTVKLLMESDAQISASVITEMLSMAEPFRSNREFTEEILSKMLKGYSDND